MSPDITCERKDKSHLRRVCYGVMWRTLVNLNGNQTVMVRNVIMSVEGQSDVVC